MNKVAYTYLIRIQYGATKKLIIEKSEDFDEIWAEQPKSVVEIEIGENDAVLIVADQIDVIPGPDGNVLGRPQ